MDHLALCDKSGISRVFCGSANRDPSMPYLKKHCSSIPSSKSLNLMKVDIFMLIFRFLTSYPYNILRAFTTNSKHELILALSSHRNAAASPYQQIS
ncbi:uncharacterized protein PHALS_11486 [Plasmopara halstedii]|uniref:Uncharacterized protein n=1 Tax=Plasmopara halstedii TaxID=4781 RepID=A0A0P1A646_PLAHL|nr:uncharacterized protein PHALS_11486 [Plasmopara halstedii]CEG35615.1 hypothetical protein PHALS_11486 [Plasmopara halstedii]|eukprot:XP_024571984.1 hypothetical protein PHALS_11486 [Plasmopara halstedii]